MNVDQLANTPAELKIEGFDSAANPMTLTIMLARSLPMSAVAALDKVHIALGRDKNTPYHRVMPQLRVMAAMVRDAVAAKDAETANMIDMDRSVMLRKLTEDLESGRGEQLTADVASAEGRQTIPGIIAEISERAKHAGIPAKPHELAAVITVGNAAIVFADMLRVIGEPDCPTAAT